MLRTNIRSCYILVLIMLFINEKFGKHCLDKGNGESKEQKMILFLELVVITFQK